MIKLPAFSDVSVLVLGDLILDRYWLGDTGRISPEAPVPVVHIQEQRERVGGAGNVALNLSALGLQAQLLGVIGQDEAAQTLRRLLADHKVRSGLVVSDNQPTITKLRILSRNQQLIRLDREESLKEESFDQSDLLGRYEAALKACSAVIISDYGKGTVYDPQTLIGRARAAQLPVLIDPKGADYSRYRGASLITPNRAEFEAVVGGFHSDAELADKAENLRQDLELDALLITRSEEGMSLFRRGQAPLNLPAAAREVYDVTGAGDTVIALFGAGLAAGLSFEDGARLANLGAGIVVGKLGTATASLAELRRASRVRHTDGQGILDLDTLLAYRDEAKAHDETVVMTNGCFDLLHPGHVKYLEQARSLGDWLVVAVNDDDSVRRLKGAGRPINPLRHRMQVLQGLGCVDWVVPFSEDTPEELIRQVQPDVLVKGGDYKAEDVAGGESVLDAGGRVEIIDFIEGYSSSGIIDRVLSSQS